MEYSSARCGSYGICIYTPSEDTIREILLVELPSFVMHIQFEILSSLGVQYIYLHALNISDAMLMRDVALYCYMSSTCILMSVYILMRST